MSPTYFLSLWVKLHRLTSTRATNEAIIIAKHSPASNVGAPHWKGYGTLILQCFFSTSEMNSYQNKGLRKRWRNCDRLLKCLPRCSTYKSRAVNTAMYLCLCSSILVCTTSSKNVCIQPYNSNGEDYRKPVKHRLCHMNSMR